MAFSAEKKSNVRFQSMPNFRRLHAQDSSKENKIITRLYRSSRPDFLTEQEVATFRELGIKSVVDFRSAKEYRKANGSKILDYYFPVYKVKLPLYRKYKITDSIAYKPVSDGFGNGTKNVQPQGRHYLINFFKMNYIMNVFNRAPWYLKLYSMLYLLVDVIMNTGYRYFVRLFAKHILNKEGLVGQYKDMVKYSQNQIYAALKLLCDSDNVPAMLNCAHGKDRTGIVSALVLVCFNCPKEYIALDYAKSEDELAPIKSRVHDEIVNKFHMCESFTGAKAQSMLQVLNHIEEEYGSLQNYLEYIGFTAEDQATLRQNLTM